MSQDTLADFDWVGAQAQCTARSMFERLRTRVREDVVVDDVTVRLYAPR